MPPREREGITVREMNDIVRVRELYEENEVLEWV